MALSLDEALGMSLVDEADESIHVDIDTRYVTIPESQQVFGVESDEDVEVKHIVIDGRYNDGTDLSTFTFRVNYQNANGDKGTYLATELKVNDDSIEFDWVIGRQVVAYKGTIAFIVCAYTIDSSSVIQNEWNSTLGKGTTLEGLEVSEFDFGDDIVRQLASILSDVNAAQASAKASADEAYKSKTEVVALGKEQQAAIEKKGKDTLATIPDDYAQVSNDVSQLKEATSALKDGKISKFYASSQGNTNLPDSDDGRIMDLKLYGKSEQKQYTGYNTIKPFDDASGTESGVKWTLKNGVLTMSGTCTATGAVINIGATTKAFDANNSKGIFETTGSFARTVQYDFAAMIASDKNSYAVEADKNIRLYMYEGTDYTGTLAVALADVSVSQTTFEPYVGGIPSPNPDYPQEIKSVVNPVVKVIGKNLFDNINKSVDASGWTTTKIVYIPKGKYVYKRFVDASSNGKINTQLYALIDGLWKSISNDSTTSFDDGNITFIDGNWNMGWGTTSRVIFELKKGYYMRASNPSADVRLMLVAGDTEPTEYEECKETTATLPYTLNAIPVTSGGNVTIDGQQYVADYVDVERGKLVKNVLTLNASDVAWELDRGWSGEGYYTYSTKSGFINQLYYNSRVASAISNAFIAKSRNDHANSLRNVIMLAGSEIYIEFIGTDKSTLQEWTNYIETNPVMIFAALKNPTETDLTADEIAAFKSLVSYYPVTNVSTTSDQLDGYTVFNYPISLANGWNYVKQQLGDTRDYLYGIDLMTAEAYVNSEYAAALAEIEV